MFVQVEEIEIIIQTPKRGAIHRPGFIRTAAASGQ
jgi:hypothetical protein